MAQSLKSHYRSNLTSIKTPLLYRYMGGQVLGGKIHLFSFLTSRFKDILIKDPKLTSPPLIFSIQFWLEKISLFNLTYVEQSFLSSYLMELLQWCICGVRVVHGFYIECGLCWSKILVPGWLCWYFPDTSRSSTTWLSWQQEYSQQMELPRLFIFRNYSFCFLYPVTIIDNINLFYISPGKYNVTLEW